MKHLLTLLLILSFTKLSEAAELRSIQKRGTKLFYYFSASTVPKPGRFVVFMDGGVSQYMNKTSSDTVALASQLENNANLIPYCSGGGFDLIIPIAYDHNNWLGICAPSGSGNVLGLMLRYMCSTPSGSGKSPLHYAINV